MPTGHAATAFFGSVPQRAEINSARPGRVLKPAKSPITGGLEGSVYTLKNELSISSGSLPDRSKPGLPEPQIPLRKPDR